MLWNKGLSRTYTEGAPMSQCRNRKGLKTNHFRQERSPPKTARLYGMDGGLKRSGKPADLKAIENMCSYG
ncbi:hypothetical protein M9H77_05276 [Catharanthus roseus]|uniref:Uncharacterized protein n=1 Tax=Catharanthus roseus TaxID=4058 RepID=A0ACC0CGV7_CATRO|nr:hypothetical protein M9H77_05276 [Catharanthus roseus]